MCCQSLNCSSILPSRQAGACQTRLERLHLQPRNLEATNPRARALPAPFQLRTRPQQRQQPPADAGDAGMGDPADGPLLISCQRQLHSLSAEAGLFQPTKRDTVVVVDPGGRELLRREGGWEREGEGRHA